MVYVQLCMLIVFQGHSSVKHFENLMFSSDQVEIGQLLILSSSS